MKVILWAGQSLGDAMFTLGSSVSPVSGTHMWNGSSFVAPTGDGACTYANVLRALLGEDIYLINACVGGSALLQNDNGGTGYWLDPASGQPLANAFAKTAAAIAAISGCTGLDRIEWWQGQQDCFVQGYADMYSNYMAGLGGLRTLFDATFGPSRFCIWPVGRLPSGSSQQVVRAQMVYALADPPTREPGPSSHDLATADGTHLTAASYATMGYRGALNAFSYFCAKAAGTLATPHYGAGPQVTAIVRAGTEVLVMFATKPGAWLTPQNPWLSPGVFTQSDINLTTNWGLWWGNFQSQLNLTDGRIVGGQVRLICDTGLANPVRVGHAWERYCSGADVYDSNGQVALPLTPDMLVSA